MSKIIRKCVLKGQKEALGYAWCFPMVFSYESDSKAHYNIKVYISKFREYTSFASSLFFASATYVNGDRSNCIHFNIK